jgi:hypothetical protein
MTVTVCLASDNIVDPSVGGHLWVHLNWALSFRASGCNVIWLEEIAPSSPPERIRTWVAALKSRLAAYGLADHLALFTRQGRLAELPDGCLDLTDAIEADLLLSLRYDLPQGIVSLFRRSALIDLDPGLLQFWMAAGHMCVARHDVSFTTAEGIAERRAGIPLGQCEWSYVPPPVALDWWPVRRAEDGASFTTVSQWWEENSWFGNEADGYQNDKRSGFLPYIDLPRRTRHPVELALALGPKDEEERAQLEQRGWRVRRALEVASTPDGYREYIQTSRGEFSCAKPAYVRLGTAWLSDRTVCYLASGKPAIVQHTGPSRFLPDAAGLFRFRDLDEAAQYIDDAAADYNRQCVLARRLAEEHFDGRIVAARVLDRVLG